MSTLKVDSKINIKVLVNLVSNLSKLIVSSHKPEYLI